LELANNVIAAVSARGDDDADLQPLVDKLKSEIERQKLSRRVFEAVRGLERQIASPVLPGLAVGAARRVARLIQTELDNASQPQLQRASVRPTPAASSLPPRPLGTSTPAIQRPPTAQGVLPARSESSGGKTDLGPLARRERSG